MSIIVSVIIPSAGRRPELLQQAIKSALIDDEKVQTEILVILNGEVGMDFDESSSFQHPLVKYYKLEEGNVSKARNYGLSIAQGELIRFLDDDDYLILEVAYQQYTELYNSDADLSTYAGAIEDDETRYQVVESIDIDDYCSATLSAYCPALTFASVYKLKNIKNLRWDEKIFIVEDEKWMRTISAYSEIKWIKSHKIVAVWYQHKTDRLSVSTCYAHSKFFINRYLSIYETLKKLEVENRLTLMRKEIASQGLWSCIHGGFYFSPIFWTKIALYARTLDPNSRPGDPFFHKLPNWIHPLVIEWLMLPKRWMNHQFRKLKYKLGYSSYIRKI